MGRTEQERKQKASDATVAFKPRQAKRRDLHERKIEKEASNVAQAKPTLTPEERRKEMAENKPDRASEPNRDTDGKIPDTVVVIDAPTFDNKIYEPGQPGKLYYDYPHDRFCWSGCVPWQGKQPDVWIDIDVNCSLSLSSITKSLGRRITTRGRVQE